MRRGLALLCLLVSGCARCSPDVTPPPPPRDELVTALVHFREVIPAAKTDEARRTLAAQIVKIAAAQDACFAADGDVVRHRVYPEPPEACLTDGTCFSGYLQYLAQAEQKEFGVPDGPELAARTTALAADLTVERLEAELARREQYVVERVAKVPGISFRGTGEQTVYLLSTGHRIEAKRDAAIDRILASHPGRVRFGEVKHAQAPALFDALGRRLTAVAVLDGKVLFDVVHEEQWLELLFPAEALPPLHTRFPDLSVTDAHAHVTPGAGPRLRAILDAEMLKGAVVVALPKATDLTKTNEDVLAVARTEAPFIVPFVTLDDAAPDAPDVMRALLRRGARGLKLLTGHDDLYRGLGSRPLDPPPLRAVFTELESRALPVLWHVNTHLYAQGFLRMLQDHPRATVVNPHLGGYLTYAPGIVRKLLVRYPNLSFDLSFGVQPRYLRRAIEDLSASHDAWRALLLEFPDRFLFGLDLVVTPSTSLAHVRMLDRLYRDLLESEEFDLDFFPARGFSKLGEESHHHAHLRGLSLPKDVLRKIYSENAARLYGAK